MSILDLVFIFVVVLSVLWYVRHLNNQYQARKFVYRMYELRDKLRHLATLGLVPEDEMFHYFDRSFCRAIKAHEYLNLYTLLYIYWKHKDKPDVRHNESILKEYCKQHSGLAEIYAAYHKTLMHYIKGQHKFSFVIFNAVLKVAVSTTWLTKSVSDAVKGLLVYPEFSESSTVDLQSLRKANFA